MQGQRWKLESLQGCQNSETQGKTIKEQVKKIKYRSKVLKKHSNKGEGADRKRDFTGVKKNQCALGGQQRAEPSPPCSA